MVSVLTNRRGNVRKSTARIAIHVNRINEARYPDYHSLNLRFDRRFYFSGSNLVLYVSAWNVYDRKNVASYFWNEIPR